MWRWCLWPTIPSMTLADFETLVLMQPQTVPPWAPVTDYSWEARRAVDEPYARLLIEHFAPKLVLDAGCGHGYLVRALRAQGTQAGGFDLHPALGPRRPAFCKYGNLNQQDVDEDPFSGPTICGFCPGVADLVVCREVLEHLPILQIHRAIRNLCRLSSRFVFLTTRFNLTAQSPWDVLTHDDSDPSHISLLPKDLVRSWFILEGFRARPDLEELMDWRHFQSTLVYERAA